MPVIPFLHNGWFKLDKGVAFLRCLFCLNHDFLDLVDFEEKKLYKCERLPVR